MNKVDLRTHLTQNEIEQDLRRLIVNIAVTSKYISAKIGEANRKLSDTKNLYGEEQLELDKEADKILMERFRHSNLVREFASEEQDEVVLLTQKEGKYSVTVDPLDGSSLVDTNLAIGTIIGIHEGDLIVKGRSNLIAAMYILYGPLTTLVYSTGKGVHEFVLNPQGEFVLSQDNIMLKEKGKIYSPGGKKSDWTAQHKEYIDYLESEGYKLRYSGGFVPDINQVLIKGGGIFTYPALVNAPKGKLRCLFELEPMAFIFEQAGGKATNGKERILDLSSESLDQRSPIYIGSKHEVEKAEEFLKR